MNLKKMMLLASMALAAIAFAAPAAAQAVEFNNATESYEGKLKFAVAGVGSYECTVTAAVQSSGGSTGTVETFQPSTAPGDCVGTGVFTGCTLENDTSSVPFSVHVLTAGDLEITDKPGNIIIHNVYGNCPFVPETTLEFESVTATPTPATGPIHEIHISGTDITVGAVASGSLVAEGEELLELN
jgi:hypothetical protein